MLTDEHIMSQVSQGDIRQSGLLFERYQTKMYNFYLRNTRDIELSKDLTQQVFIKLIKYRKSYKNQNSFKIWLYRIATNLKHDHYRKEKAHIIRNQAYSDNREEFIDPNIKDEKSERSVLLHKALNRLSKDYREVIWLTRFEKLRYAEVAQILETTESAIKVRVHRAMKKLKIEYLELVKS